MPNIEIAYEWFKELINNEVEQELGTIDNERIWSNGSVDDEGVNMHENNIALHELYIRILKEAYRNTIGNDYDDDFTLDKHNNI